MVLETGGDLFWEKDVHFILSDMGKLILIVI